MARVLIIDDDQMICRSLAAVVERLGHEAATALTLAEGLDRVAAGRFDVVFLDVRLPDGNGLEALPWMRRSPSSPEVIIITGKGDPDGAELAIKSGAWDYVEKPASLNMMTLPLVRALQYRGEKTGDKPPVALKRDGIIGHSPQIMACLDLVAQAAHSPVNLLITGETGTGKELFARAIHQNSPRAPRNFVVVDCAALPATLVESVLFGHEKGSFTGADQAHVGLIRQAHGGTLFLDEVGELPLAVQKAFLRVLEERRFRPVGGREEIESDFRLVAATNRDLALMVKEGLFRHDLLFRLETLRINLPSLGNRGEDLRDLTMYHTARLCHRYGVATKGFAPEFFEALAAYPWPGNVRELVNTLEMVIGATREEEGALFPKHLPTYIRVHVARSSLSRDEKPGPEEQRTPTSTDGLPALKAYRAAAADRAEKEYLVRLLSTPRTVHQACRVSGLSRSRLYELLKKHHLAFPEG
ncbi:MAG: sigma-54 dependent transcriptional regulator [Thermodesulfobacteriota bacterium]